MPRLRKPWYTRSRKSLTRADLHGLAALRVVDVGAARRQEPMPPAPVYSRRTCRGFPEQSPVLPSGKRAVSSCRRCSRAPRALDGTVDLPGKKVIQPAVDVRRWPGGLNGVDGRAFDIQRPDHGRGIPWVVAQMAQQLPRIVRIAAQGLHRLCERVSARQARIVVSQTAQGEHQLRLRVRFITTATTRGGRYALLPFHRSGQTPCRRINRRRQGHRRALMMRERCRHWPGHYLHCLRSCCLRSCCRRACCRLSRRGRWRLCH